MGRKSGETPAVFSSSAKLQAENDSKIHLCPEWGKNADDSKVRQM